VTGGIALEGSHQPASSVLPTDPQLAGRHSNWLSLRLRGLLQQARLDRLLAEGADPAETAALSLRARQLQRPRRRRALAKGLEGAIVQAKRYSGSHIDSPISQEEVARAHPLLLSLAERLRGHEAVSPRGVAIVKLLLTDSTSPIFSPGWSRARAAPGELERQARAALAALDERPCDLPMDSRRR
jgi:hypothetical protein